MGIDRETLSQLSHLLRPLATRLANTVARAVVQLVDDDKKRQLAQLGVLAGETVDGAEHFQPYGFSSVPLAGAEAVVVFPNGDRSHPLVVATSDNRHRPTGGEPGQVTMHHYKGAKVTMLENGDIEVTPGPSGEVLVSDGTGGAEPLVKLSEFMAHGHAAFSAPPTATTPGPPSPDFSGSKVLKAN